MTAHLPTFEVKVKVKDGSKIFSSFLGMFVQHETVKMFHKDARTGNQAMSMCEKYGRPISYHKADVSKMLGNMENLPLEQAPYSDGNPYDSAIAMDEFIWKKKDKRKKRIENQGKDKKT